MANTLAPLAPDMLHIRMHKHTGEAYQLPKDPAPRVHPRFQTRVNFLWPAEGPRELPRALCWSVHMCESSGTLSPMEIAGGMCVVVGPSAVGGLELKQSYLWRLRHLLAQSTQRRVMETHCTWR